MKLGDLNEAVEAGLIGFNIPGQNGKGFLDIASVNGDKVYALVDFLDAAQDEFRKYFEAETKLAGNGQEIEKLRATEISLEAPKLFTREELAKYRLSAGHLRSMKKLGMIEEAAPEAAKENAK